MRGRHKEADHWTELEVHAPVTVHGEPPDAAVYVNRDYLLQALHLGLWEVGIQDPLRPVRFGHGGGHHRQLIVMPVRVEADSHDSPVPASTPPPTSSPVNPIITTPANGNSEHGPAVPVPPVAVDHPSPVTTTPTIINHPPARNTTPMPNGTHTNHASNTNGNGQHSVGAIVNGSPDEETHGRPTIEAALEQIEAIKGAIRASVSNLNALADSLRAIQRERRHNEREVRNVRETLKSLQTVRL